MMTRRTRLTTRAALLGLVVVALALTLVYPLRLYLAQRGQIDKMTAANQAQQQQVEALRKAVTRYNDPNWVRDQARLRLHYAAPGERVLVVPRGASAGPSPTPGAASTRPASPATPAGGSGLAQVRRVPATASPSPTPLAP